MGRRGRPRQVSFFRSFLPAAWRVFTGRTLAPPRPVAVPNEVAPSPRAIRRGPPPVPPRSSPAAPVPLVKPAARSDRARLIERDLSELLGLAKGMLADGVITEEEAEYLRAWCRNHPDAVACWPANQISTRLTRCFQDGHIPDAERLALRDLLANLVGGTASLVLGYEAATTLPLDEPAPRIRWRGQVYVFTGRFAYGTRGSCEREVTRRGGRCEDTITHDTTFVVVGTFSNPAWAHSSYGRKLQKAVQLREEGHAIKIVGEDHWANALSPSPVASDEQPF